MEKKKNIFKPLSSLPMQEWASTSIDKIIKTIPPHYYNYKNEELHKNNIEWRWRFIKINNDIFVEISYKKPNNKRLFINKSGKWTEKYIDAYYDQFVKKEIYYYSQK
jgi:hypothetical protein